MPRDIVGEIVWGFVEEMWHECKLTKKRAWLHILFLFLPCFAVIDFIVSILSSQFYVSSNSMCVS